jgi:hypothetical protein
MRRSMSIRSSHFAKILMTTIKLCFLALATASLLTACGGDSAAPAAPVANDPADKYVGTWVRCNKLNLTVNGDNSFTDEGVITKAGASSYQVVAARNSFVSANCTGTASPVVGESATTVYTIVGSATASGVAADKVTYPAGPGLTNKDLIYVNGNQLQEGNLSSTKDADGFPSELTTAPYIKR